MRESRRAHRPSARTIAAVLGYFLLGVATIWGAMALHFDGPDPGWLRQGLAAGFVLLMALAARLKPRRPTEMIPRGA